MQGIHLHKEKNIMECQQGPLLPTEFSYTSTEIGTWIIKYTYIKGSELITSACPNFNTGLAKLPMTVGHIWVIHLTKYDGFD